MNNKTENLKFDKYVDFKKEFRILKREVNHLKDFLYRYSRHLEGCQYTFGDINGCSCGFFKDLAALNRQEEGREV